MRARPRGPFDGRRIAATALPLCAALAVLGARQGGAVAAPAAGPGVTIRWAAPAGCPDEAALRAEIERLLGRPLGPAGDALGIAGAVTRDAADAGAAGAAPRFRLRLTITFDGLAKERRLEGATCAQVTGAAAVVLALAIDPSAPPPPSPPSLDAAPPDPAAPSPSAPLPVAPLPPSPFAPLPVAPLRFSEASSEAGSEAPPAEPPEPRRPVWDLAALTGVDFISLPGVAAGVGLGVGLDLGPDRIELRAMAWLPHLATVLTDLSTPVGSEVSLYAAGLRYCRWLVRGAFDLAPCGGLEAGALVNAAVGAPAVSAGPSRWLAPELGLLGTFHVLPRFGISLAADGLVPIFRDEFVIVGAGLAYRPPPATFRAVLGAHLRFP